MTHTEIELTTPENLMETFARYFNAVAENCGLVAPDVASCHCRKRVPVAIRLGRVDPTVADAASHVDVRAAVTEMETLHDAAAWPGSGGEEPVVDRHVVVHSAW